MSHVSVSCVVIMLFFLTLPLSDYYRPATALYRWAHWHISVCTNGGWHHRSCTGGQVRLLFIYFVCFSLYLFFTPHLSSTLYVSYPPQLFSGGSGYLAKQKIVRDRPHYNSSNHCAVELSNLIGQNVLINFLYQHL